MSDHAEMRKQLAEWAESHRNADTDWYAPNYEEWLVVFDALVKERDEANLIARNALPGKQILLARVAAAEAERDEAVRQLHVLDEFRNAAEAERDAAQRDWQMYVHEVEDEKARAEAAEAECVRLREALTQIAAMPGTPGWINTLDPVLTAKAALAAGTEEG